LTKNKEHEQEKEWEKRSAIRARFDRASHAIDFCRRRFCQGSLVVEQPRKHSGLVVQEKFASFSARNKRQGSSVVEQGTHKPLVGSSTLPPGIFLYGLGHTSFAALQADTTLVQLSISMSGLLSICVATL
jgi:hypothetical protein